MDPVRWLRDRRHAVTVVLAVATLIVWGFTIRAIRSLPATPVVTELRQSDDLPGLADTAASPATDSSAHSDKELRPERVKATRRPLEPTIPPLPTSDAAPSAPPPAPVSPVRETSTDTGRGPAVEPI